MNAVLESRIIPTASTAYNAFKFAVKCSAPSATELI